MKVTLKLCKLLDSERRMQLYRLQHPVENPTDEHVKELRREAANRAGRIKALLWAIAEVAASEAGSE